MEKLKLASAILRRTKFGKEVVDNTTVFVGLFFAIVAFILTIIGAVKYVKDRQTKTSSFGKTTEILFYSLKDCGHCIKFKDEWKKLQELTKNNKDNSVNSLLSLNSSYLNKFHEAKSHTTVCSKSCGNIISVQIFVPSILRFLFLKSSGLNLFTL
jgi:hypothetical protein